MKKLIFSFWLSCVLYSTQAQFYDPKIISSLKISELKEFGYLIENGKSTGDSVIFLKLDYDKKGNCIKSEIAGDSTIKQWNADGKIVKSTRYTPDKVDFIEDYIYNGKGYLTTSTWYRPSNESRNISNFKYDKYDRVTEGTVTNLKDSLFIKTKSKYLGHSDKLVSSFSETNGKSRIEKAYITKKYNSKSQVVAELNKYFKKGVVNEEIRFVSTYVYINGGKIEHTKIFKKNDLESDEEKYYDKKGNQINTFQTINGVRKLMASSTYNDKNQMTKSMAMNGTVLDYARLPDNSPDYSKPISTYKEYDTFYTYNADGILATTTTYCEGKMTEKHKCYYTKFDQ